LFSDSAAMFTRIKSSLYNVQAWASSAQGKRWLAYLRRLFVTGLILFLFYRLTQLGWREVLEALPSNPLFYLFFLGIYFTLPVTESLIYGYLWKVNPLKVFPVSFRKRVYNREVLGYSGEVYLYLWAHRILGLNKRKAFKDIRDNTIISSIISTMVAAGLLAAFLLTGQIHLPFAWDNQHQLYAIGGGFLITGIIVLLIRYRHLFFGLSRKQTMVLTGLHFMRLLLVNTFQIAEWHVVLPAVPLSIWFTFLSTLIILNRIPFLPSRDLIFLGTSMELSEWMQLSTTSVAGMLLVATVLDKTLNAVLFTLLSFLDRKKGVEPSEELPQESEASLVES